MSYFRLTLDYRRILAAGFFLCFFSGFGQSFFISVFTPHFLNALLLSPSDFGLLYAAATLASGLLLPWIGSLLDRVHPIWYATWALLGFALSCFLMAGVQSVLVFAIALFGVRICGQGLFSHISATVVARGFSVYRGRALSLVGLGHPVSEAILPLLAVYLVSHVGWRGAWVIFGGLLVFLFLPSLIYLLKGKPETTGVEDLSALPVKKTFNPLRRFPDFLRAWRFWFLVLGTILPGSILTGLFLYHSSIASERGWSMAWMASGFMWFAASQILFSLFGGSLMDKFGAKKLFAFYLVPFSASLALLSLPSSNIWIVPGYLVLAGITAGLGSPIKTALWVEIYGTRQIASVRSWVGAISVTGTAASPALLGFSLDAGMSFSRFLFVSSMVVFLYCVVYSFFLRRIGF